jgi:hypothetical protein
MSGPPRPVSISEPWIGPDGRSYILRAHRDEPENMWVAMDVGGMWRFVATLMPVARARWEKALRYIPRHGGRGYTGSQKARPARADARPPRPQQ